MFIESGGGDLEKSNPDMPPFSPSEKSWLRLQAGKCFLKMVQFKGVGDQFTAAQYCTLAKLMIDPVDQVRFHFHQKLHRRLTRGFPNKCLPLDFLGFYGLAHFETDRKEKQVLKKNFSWYVKVRRDWVQIMKRNLSEEKQKEQMVGVLPDYALAYAVIVLTFLPDGGNGGEGEEGLMERLGDARKGMMGILDGLMVGGKEGEGWSYGFFKKLMEGVKNRVNGVDPLDEEVNRRMWAICDLVMDMVMQKSQGKGGKVGEVEYPGEAKVPGLFFKRKEGSGEEWRNDSSYLPEGFLEGLGGRKKSGGGKGASMLKTRNVKKRGRDEVEGEEDGGDQSEIEEVAPPSAKQSRVEDGGSEGSNVNATAATPEVEEVENEENEGPEEKTSPLEGKRRGEKRSFEVGTRRSGRLREDDKEKEVDGDVDFIPATPSQASESPLQASSPQRKRGRGKNS